MRGALVVASPISALTVSAAQQSKPVPTGTGSISGRVIHADTQRPLPDVIMTLTTMQGAGVLRTITDADGRYSFDGIAPGLYRVTTFLEGYANQEPLTTSSGRLEGAGMVAVGDGKARRGIDFSLLRGASLAGRITSAEGKPLEDAVVRAMFLRENSFPSSADTVARTSERGEYVIRNLPAGLYQLSVMWNDPEMLRAKAGVETQMTYFPGTREMREAMSLTVRSGAELRGIDIRLPPSDRVRFSGFILRGASEGRIEANVLLPGLALRTVTIAEDDGAFEVTHLEPGPFTFWARATTPNGFEAAWTELDLGTDMIGQVLPMTPTAEIRGRVVMNDGSRLPKGLQVAANLVNESGTQIDPLPRDRTDVEDDGTFRLRGVFGHRTLTVIGLTHEHMLDRGFQGSTAVKMLSVSSGESVDEVTLVVRKRD